WGGGMGCFLFFGLPPPSRRQDRRDHGGEADRSLPLRRRVWGQRRACLRPARRMSARDRRDAGDGTRRAESVVAGAGHSLYAVLLLRRSARASQWEEGRA